MHIEAGICLIIIFLSFNGVQGEVNSTVFASSEMNPLKFIEPLQQRCLVGKQTVLLISDGSTFIKLPEFIYSDSIIVLNMEHAQSKKNISPHVKYIKNIEVFIFVFSSYFNMFALLKIVEASNWWNSDGQFLFISTDESCLKFSKFLQLTYNSQRIFPYLMCNNDIIYTINPYAKWAPTPWKPLDSTLLTQNDPGYFYFNFTADEYNCSNLLYDRRKIIRKSRELKFVLEISKTDVCSLQASPKKSAMLNYTIRIIQLLSNLMNIPFDKHLTCLRSKSYTDSNAFGKGQAIEGIAEGKYSALLNPQPMRDTRRMLVSAITSKMQVVIIMHHRRALSIFQRISRILGTWGYVTYLIFGLFTTVVLKCCLKASFTLSAMRTLSMLLVDVTTFRSTRDSLRIFLVVIWFVGFAMETTFGNHILSIIFSAKYDDVKTVKDFEAIASEYKLYCPPGINIYVNEFLEQSCYPIEEHGCEVILKDPGAACFYYKHLSYELVVKNDLHIVPEDLAYAYMTYKMKNTWKFRERFNRACTRLFQSHIPTVLIDEYYYDVHRELEMLKLINFRVLKLNDLLFAFQILYIGLGFAFTSFLCEIKVWNYVSNMVKRVEDNFCTCSV